MSIVDQIAMGVYSNPTSLGEAVQAGNMLGKSIGGAIAAKYAADRKNALRSLAQNALSGDKSAMNALAAQDPAYAKQIYDMTQPKVFNVPPGGSLISAQGSVLYKGATKPTTPEKGWHMLYDPDSGARYRYNPNISNPVQKQGPSGLWMPDTTIDVSKLKKLGGSGGFGSSMNQRFVNRVSGAANEGAAALISMAGMKNPSSGLFSARSVSGGLGKNIIAGVMAPEGVKRYNATIAGLAPEIAAAQNQGLAPTEEQIHALDSALTIGPTDDLTTKQYKIALGARYLRKAMEVSRDLGNPDQKARIDKIAKQLSVFPEPDAILDGSWNQGVFGKQYPISGMKSAPKATATGQQADPLGIR